MELEVVKLSKIEKSTDQGIKDIFAVQLEGDDVDNETQIAVHGKVILSCEHSPEPLSKLVGLVIGNKRRLSLTAVDHELDDFAEPEKEAPAFLVEGQTVLSEEFQEGNLDSIIAVQPEPEQAASTKIQDAIQELLAWDSHNGSTLEDHLVNNYKKDMLIQIAHALHLAAPKSDLPQKTAFNIAVQINALKTKQAVGARQ